MRLNWGSENKMAGSESLPQDGEAKKLQLQTSAAELKLKEADTQAKRADVRLKDADIALKKVEKALKEIEINQKSTPWKSALYNPTILAAVLPLILGAVGTAFIALNTFIISSINKSKDTRSEEHTS